MNKQQELAIVDAFVEFSGVPGLTLHERERERPDALIASPVGLVGVEVTTLSEEEPREATSTQQWLAEGNRLVKATRQAFESINSTPVVVNIGMASGWSPPGRRASAQLESELAALIDQALVNPPPWPRREEPYELHDPHPSVEWIYIGRTRRSSHWAPSIAGETRFASAKDIAHTVARKEPLVETYRQVAPQVWLLIDCNVFGQGVALDVPGESFAVRTAFDRVFCCGFGGWRWVEIPVERTSPVTTG